MLKISFVIYLLIISLSYISCNNLSNSLANPLQRQINNKVKFQSCVEQHHEQQIINNKIEENSSINNKNFESNNIDRITTLAKIITSSINREIISNIVVK